MSGDSIVPNDSDVPLLGVRYKTFYCPCGWPNPVKDYLDHGTPCGQCGKDNQGNRTGPIAPHECRVCERPCDPQLTDRSTRCAVQLAVDAERARAAELIRFAWENEDVALAIREGRPLSACENIAEIVEREP